MIPPSMHHYWEYTPSSTDTDGCIHYLMVAFSHTFVLKCIEVFPELRNRLAGLTFPVNALKFGLKSSRIIRKMLSQMNEMYDIDCRTNAATAESQYVQQLTHVL